MSRRALDIFDPLLARAFACSGLLCPRGSLIHNESLRVCSLLPNLGPPESRVSGFHQIGGLVSPSELTSMIGDLFPIALWGRSSL